MDNSVSSAIEKIKLQEQDNEAKLREKRELSSAILSLNRSIHENTKNIEKLTKEYQHLINTTDKLQHRVTVETIRLSALNEQVDECGKELEGLRKNCISGISSVWDKRSQLFETVHSTSDKCDIWALLMKPACEIKANPIHIPKTEQVVVDDSKLKAAIERKSKAVALRNYLLAEPDAGEEFVRTRNALQYSMEIMANHQQN